MTVHLQRVRALLLAVHTHVHCLAHVFVCHMQFQVSAVRKYFAAFFAFKINWFMSFDKNFSDLVGLLLGFWLVAEWFGVPPSLFRSRLCKLILLVFLNHKHCLNLRNSLSLFLKKISLHSILLLFVCLLSIWVTIPIVWRHLRDWLSHRMFLFQLGYFRRVPF